MSVALLAVGAWLVAPYVRAEETEKPKKEQKEQPKEEEKAEQITEKAEKDETSDERTDEQAKKKKIERRKAQQEAQRKAMEDYMEKRKKEEEARKADPAWKASHEQVAVIQVIDDEGKPFKLNNFCLNTDGNVLAACGGQWNKRVKGDESGKFKVITVSEPAAICVLSPEGKLLKSWPLEFKPQAICVANNGEIFVGGAGRLAKLDQNGKVLAMAESPAVAVEKTEPKKETDGDKDTEKKKTEKEETALTKVATSILRALGFRSKEWEEERAKEEAARVAAAMIRRAREVTGIAVTGDDLFVARPMVKSWGYAVWRTNRQFTEPKRIIKGLRGCCGQMDIQAKDGEVWVAHNARHRVERYDRDGKKLFSFGKRDRKEAKGFGGCCEPKNLRFGAEGEVYTSESGPPVAIKRFTVEGDFLGVVGVPEYKTGCVRATVDVSRDGSRVFVFNPGGNAIHVLTDKRSIPVSE